MTDASYAWNKSFNQFDFRWDIPAHSCFSLYSLLQNKICREVYGLLAAAIIFSGVCMLFYCSMVPRFLGGAPEVKRFVGLSMLAEILVTCGKLSLLFLVGTIYKKVKGEYPGRLLVCLGIAFFFAFAALLFIGLNWNVADLPQMHTILDQYEILYKQKNI